MGKLLDELISEIKENDMTSQVNEICKEIWKEERPNVKHHKILPEGANIFLALEMPPKGKGEATFLSLERDPLEEYVSVYYSMRIRDFQKIEVPVMPKRVKTHRLEGRSAKKIMTEFAKLVKFYRGE